MFRKYLIDIERWWQRGAVLAFFAMGLPAFIAMTGLVLELGHLYFEQADLQNTVESVARATLKKDSPTWVPLSDEVYKSLQNDSNSIVPSNSEEKLSGRETLSTYSTNAEDYVQKINEELEKESKTSMSYDDSVVTARTSGNNTYLEFTLKKDFQNWFSGFFGIGGARTASTVAKIVPPEITTHSNELGPNGSLDTLEEQLEAAGVDIAKEKRGTITNSISEASNDANVISSYSNGGTDTGQNNNTVYRKIEGKDISADKVVITNGTETTYRFSWIWNNTTDIYLEKNADGQGVILQSVITTGSGTYGEKPVYIRIDDDFDTNLTLAITDSNASDTAAFRKPVILVYEGTNSININITFYNERLKTFQCTILAPNATVNITKSNDTKEVEDYKIEGWIVAKQINNDDNIPIEYKKVQ